MARIRTIKPDFFRHEKLYEAEVSSGLPLRVAFAGMFTVADREGRFKWNPRVLKLDAMPFDEVDFGEVLEVLAEHGFIRKYQVGADTYGCIPAFAKHQHVNQREVASEIPAPAEDSASTCETIPARVEGKGREQEGKGREGAAVPPALHVRLKEIQPELFEAAGIGENPSPALLNVSPILELLDKGYDLSKDVLPVIREITARGKKPTTWRYFVTAITENKSVNGAVAPKPTAVASDPVVWITEDDPRFADFAARHFEETRKQIRKGGSKYENGIGAHFPADWVAPKSSVAA